MNARLALSQIKVGPDNKGRLTVALWGKNLADKKYDNFDLTNTSADQVTTWGEPRTYGLDLIYNYCPEGYGNPGGSTARSRLGAIGSPHGS